MFKLYKVELDDSPSQVVNIHTSRTDLCLAVYDCVPTIVYLADETQYNVPIPFRVNRKCIGDTFDAFVPIGVYLGNVQLFGNKFFYFASVELVQEVPQLVQSMYIPTATESLNATWNSVSTRLRSNWSMETQQCATPIYANPTNIDPPADGDMPTTAPRPRRPRRSTRTS